MDSSAQVRRLSAAEAAIWRDIRLAALKGDPAQFSARYADWAGRPLADVAAELETAPVWAAVEAGRALAVAALTPDAADGSVAWLEAVYVRPEARGRGLARRVIAAAEAAARAEGRREIRLEVRAANGAARGLYRALGYGEAGPGGRSCGSVCEVTMTKHLADPA
jgi:ribosomal protein S18 acetylase RimI-like enzyme